MAAKKTGKRTRRARRRPAEVTLVDTVHQIWLAGLGALARAQKDGPKAFETLIVDGAGFIDRGRSEAEKTLREAIGTVQSALSERMRTTRDQAAETWDGLEKLFQTRVQRVLHQVGVPTATEIRALTQRVDALNKSVGSLARGQGKPRAAKARPVRRRGKRATA